MVTENKRYIVLQDEGAESASVTKSQSITAPDTSISGNATVQQYKFNETSRFPKAEKTSETLSDLSVSASGTVDPQFTEYNYGAIKQYSTQTSLPVNVSGSGFIQTSGSGSRSRFTYTKEGESDTQFRATYNQFNKKSQGLERNYNTSGPEDIYCRPSLLPLKNGNLLCGYLNNEAHPWMWNFQSDLYTSNSFISKWINTPSGSGRRNATIRLRLQEQSYRYWSTVSETNSSPTYVLSLPDFVQADVSTSIGAKYIGVTGLSLVQFQDTDEVLAIYCGFLGKPILGSYNPAFMCVDEITQDMRTAAAFCTGAVELENRSKVIISQEDLSASQDNNPDPDVTGLTGAHYKPLGLTAQALPSGRLVCVVAYEDSLWSFTSDDRGVTFAGTRILDLTFNDANFLQRVVSVDSTLTNDGRMSIIVTCPGLGERGWQAAEPSNSDPLAESVISIFVSGDGVSWGTEKKLGGGLFQPTYGDVDTGGTFPNSAFDDTYQDQNLFCLSGSITRTPENFYLVSLISYNLGNPGNAQAQQIFQRVLSIDELLSGQTGEDIAPTLPPQIFTQEDPLMNSYQRAVLAKYQPSLKMKDAIDTSNHETVMSYLASVGGVSGSVDPGYLGQLYFGRVPKLASYSGNFLEYGGGPFWSQGPIDIATCVWRDSVVTVSCGLYESEPVDYPNSDELVHFISNQTYEATRESFVEVLYSGGFQPANIRIPTCLRWWAPGFNTAGERPSQKLPAATIAVSEDDLTYQMGGNSWQISFNAPRNPLYQGWQQTSSTGYTSSNVHYQEDNLSLFRGIQLSSSGTGLYYWKYAQFLSAAPAVQQRVFPNYQSSSLKDASDYPGTKFFSQKVSGLSCIGRMVLNIDYGGGFNGGTNTFGANTDGLHVGCRAELQSGTSKIRFDVRVGRDQGKVGVEFYDILGSQRLAFISLTDSGGTFNSLRCPWYEVVFALVPVNDSQTNMEAKLAVRPWDQYQDPDWLNDFSTNSSGSTYPSVGTVIAGDEEEFSFGIYSSAYSANQVYFQDIQFSRSFLSIEGADLSTYQAATMPKGMEQFFEGTHMTNDMAIDSVRNFNGGFFSPNSPSQISASPQMIDRGIEVSFRGRNASDDTFSYSADSLFRSENIFSLPVSNGWRAPSTVLTCQTLRVSGAARLVNPVPDQELMFDFGERGILPESVSLFGINTDELIIDFSDDAGMTRSLSGSGSPSLSLWFSSPGGHAAKVWDYQTDYYGTTSEITYKPNYLFFWENFSTRTNQAIGFGSNDLVATLDEEANPYAIRFKTYGYDQTGLTTQQARHVPFIPNQYKSSDGENFYLVVYDAEMATNLNNSGSALTTDWSQATDCKWRHVFKIKGNGTDWIELSEKIADNFSMQQGTDATDLKIRVGSMTIISDRVGMNVPDFFPDVNKDSPGTRSFTGMNKYRYMRLRLGGAEYYDEKENYLKLGMMIAGQRMDLSTRDIDWGWNYNIEFGNKLTTGLTGQRRRRNNHKPRRVWDVSYTPKPSPDVKVTVTDRPSASPNEPDYYQNHQRGYGKIANSLLPQNTEQLSMRSKLTWTELVERVMTLQAGGEVVALAFDGDNMVNNHSLRTYFPKYGPIRPALSDPGGLVAARLVEYGGAGHVGYTNIKEIGNNPTGAGAVLRKSLLATRPIMQVTGLKFSEEL